MSREKENFKNDLLFEFIYMGFLAQAENTSPRSKSEIHIYQQFFKRKLKCTSRM